MDGGGGALPYADGAAALVPAPLLRCADHLRGAVVRQRGKLRVRAGAGWWSVWWRAPECLRSRLGSGEISVGLADTDAVAPQGAAEPSWRASGLPSLSPRRVPGETLGSSVVIVASLLGGVVRYRHFGVSELGGRSPVDAAVTRLRRFCRSAVISIYFFSFFLFPFFWACLCCFRPRPYRRLYRLVAL